ACREGAGRGQSLSLDQRVEHVVPLRYVAQDHLDELLLAVGDERGVYVEEKRPDRKFRDLRRSLAQNRDHARLQALDHFCPYLRRYRLRQRMSDHRQLFMRLVDHNMELHGSRIHPDHDPGVWFDLIHWIGRVVDRVAVLLFGFAQQPLARFDVELRDHQPPLVDCRDHQVAHPFHRGTGHRGFDVIQNDLLESNMDDVELGRLGPREHPLLAMPAQINVSANVVGIAQVISEPDESIDQVFFAGFAAILVDLGVTLGNGRYRFSPLIDDAVEVAVHQIRGLGANLDALGRAAPNCRTPWARKRSLDLSELLPYRLWFFGGGLNWRVGRFTVSLGF